MFGMIYFDNSTYFLTFGVDFFNLETKVANLCYGVFDCIFGMQRLRYCVVRVCIHDSLRKLKLLL
jgi:hypothetical protein